MKYREFGRTGLEVSEIGFGAWAIGGQSYGTVERQESLKALAVAEELGCNFVDTAAVYGDSEQILGRFLRGRRHKWVVATKYSGQQEGLLRTAEDQLRRLGTDVIDFYQLHWTPPSAHALWGQLFELKESGKARFVGVSLYSAREIDQVLDCSEIDGFQVALSLLDPLPLVACLDRVRVRRPAVVARSVLKSGFLTGKFSRQVRFARVGDHRGGLPHREVDRTLDLVDAFRFLEQGSGSLTRAAALYPLSFPEVSTEILGTKSAFQAEENFGRISGFALTTPDLQSIAGVQQTKGLLRERVRARMRATARRITSVLIGAGNGR